MEISYATPNLGRVFLVCLYSCVSCRCSALPGAPENEDQDDEEHEDEDNADQEHEDLDDEAAMALEELEIEAAHEEAQDVCFCFSSPLKIVLWLRGEANFCARWFGRQRFLP